MKRIIWLMLVLLIPFASAQLEMFETKINVTVKLNDSVNIRGEEGFNQNFSFGQDFSNLYTILLYRNISSFNDSTLDDLRSNYENLTETYDDLFNFCLEEQGRIIDRLNSSSSEEKYTRCFWDLQDVNQSLDSVSSELNESNSDLEECVEDRDSFQDSRERLQSSLTACEEDKENEESKNSWWIFSGLFGFAGGYALCYFTKVKREKPRKELPHNRESGFD